MRLDGYTIQAIADRFGTTKQNISLFLNGLASDRRRNIKKCKCIFSGLKKWMIENRVSATKLCEDIEIFGHYPKLYNRMIGKYEFTMPEIKAILAYTGLTFDEAFGVVKPLDGADKDAE